MQGRVSPRKLRRSDIPNEAFNALREMVSNELSTIPSANLMATSPGNVGTNGNMSETNAEPNKLQFGLFEDEDSRMSGCESSEGSQSQYSIEEDLTKSIAKACSEEDLPTVFGQWYDSLLDGGEQPVKCYHLDDDLSFPLFNNVGSGGRLQQLDQLLDEIQAPEEEPTNTKGKTVKKKAKEAKEADIVKAAVDEDTKSPSKKGASRKSGRLHVHRTVPDTPEEKLRDSVKETKAEVVKATPMAKVCGNPTRHRSKMSELVRISEERARIPRAAALASAKASKAIIQQRVDEINKMNDLDDNQVCVVEPVVQGQAEFDRHELERALLKSLEEERSREKEKPSKKVNKPKADKSKTAARVAPKRRRVEEPSPKAVKIGKKEEVVQKIEQPPPATQKPTVAEPVVPKKKTDPVSKRKEAASTQSSPQGSKPKKQPVVKKQDTSVSKKKEEVKSQEVAEGSSKSEESPVKEAQTTSTDSATDKKTDTEEKQQPVEATEGDSQKPKADDVEVRRAPPPYRLPSRASDLITLLACAKEVLGDHEYSSDQD
ncbi:hypothetical protein TELCIR_06794 [Teladorsagia circumcincta]|uniref:Uncharacterized protein n=1 Tax=Teladorsagia circumcincta TaxID=45464 RepID=A0A2G9UPD1_TELCI|nr:hypothetical protein TELCIR_06794 [Teladorsagia circumcincta]